MSVAVNQEVVGQDPYCNVVHFGECLFMPSGISGAGLVACECANLNDGNTTFLPVCYQSLDQWNVFSASALCRQMGLEPDGGTVLYLCGGQYSKCMCMVWGIGYVSMQAY